MHEKKKRNQAEKRAIKKARDKNKSKTINNKNKNIKNAII